MIGTVNTNATALCPYHHCTSASLAPAYIETECHQLPYPETSLVGTAMLLNK